MNIIMTYLLKTVKSYFTFRHIVQFCFIHYVYFYLRANYLSTFFTVFVKNLSYDFTVFIIFPINIYLSITIYCNFR